MRNNDRYHRNGNSGAESSKLNICNSIEHSKMQIPELIVVGSIDPENTGSIKLLKQLRIRKEAHFHKSLLVNGLWVDDIVCAILRVEWK